MKRPTKRNKVWVERKLESYDKFQLKKPRWLQIQASLGTRGIASNCEATRSQQRLGSR